MTDTARRHATDRDPRSPDAIRRRRGPDLRLAPSAALAWLAVAVIHLRSILPAPVFACVAVLLWGITRQLRRGTWAQWHQAMIGWLYTGLASAMVAAIAAGAVALRITRIDQHPLIKQAADGGGSFRGEVSVTGGVRQLAGGVAKVPVNVPGLGDVALFMNPDHLTPQVMNAQPGTGLVLAARVRASDQADLIPITLSSSCSAELAHEPQGIAGASAQVRSTIRELVRGLTETTAGTRWGSWLGDAPSLIPGMVLGDTSLMSPEVRQTFLATGLSHLTAVSGLHVAIVASSVMVATTAVGLARRTRLACVMGSILLFALVVGPEPSIIRATTMGLVGVVAVASSRWSDSLSALAVAVLLVLLCAPGMAVRYSLVLSVVATIAIIAGSPLLGRQLIRAWQRVTRRRWSRDPSVAEAMVLRAFAVAIVADVATQPIIVLMTGVFSSVAVLANVVVGFAVAPLMVVGLFAGLAGVPLLALGAPAAVGAVFYAPAVPFAWWISSVAEKLSQAPVVHVPAGWGWAFLWSVLLIILIAAGVGRLPWPAIPLVIAVFMLAHRLDVLTIGPYAPTDPQQWGRDLTKVTGWTVAVCAGDPPQIFFPDATPFTCQSPRGAVRVRAGGVLKNGGEHTKPTVTIVATEQEAARVRVADLIVVAGCAGESRSHGRPTRTTDGAYVHYLCADGAAMLTEQGLVVSGG